MNVRVRLSNLLIPPLTEYQEFLYSKIMELKKSGLGYRKISHWMNKNNYKTPRGHEFIPPSVFSIIKKRKIREAKINKPFEITYGDWYIKEE